MNAHSVSDATGPTTDAPTQGVPIAVPWPRQPADRASARDAGRLRIPAIGAMPMALGGVIALAALLNLWDLAREGYANTYYTAAVKSMLTSPAMDRLAHTSDDLTAWVRARCTAVPASRWQTTRGGTSATAQRVTGSTAGQPGASGLQLYDCAGAGHA